MNDEQWQTILIGAISFLLPQIIIWLAFGLYLILTGKT